MSKPAAKKAEPKPAAKASSRGSIDATPKTEDSIAKEVKPKPESVAKPEVVVNPVKLVDASPASPVDPVVNTAKDAQEKLSMDDILKKELEAEIAALEREEEEEALAEAEAAAEAAGAKKGASGAGAALAATGPKKEKKKKGEEKAHDEREHLNIVFIGHVDAGKSTISGQILYVGM